MLTTTIRAIQDGEDQLILLPEGFQFGDGVEVMLVRDGDVLTITPRVPPADEPLPPEPVTVDGKR